MEKIEELELLEKRGYNSPERDFYGKLDFLSKLTILGA